MIKNIQVKKTVSGRDTFKFKPTKEGYAQLGKDTIKTSKGFPLSTILWEH